MFDVVNSSGNIEVTSFKCSNSFFFIISLRFRVRSCHCNALTAVLNVCYDPSLFWPRCDCAQLLFRNSGVFKNDQHLFHVPSVSGEKSNLVLHAVHAVATHIRDRLSGNVALTDEIYAVTNELLALDLEITL